MAKKNSALAMLDRATEDALFAHFTDFFRRSEQDRHWNLWSDIPWESVNPSASEDLTTAVETAYAREIFLPDYSAKLIRMLRSSRGRAWFLTRWSYEESKHFLALAEWLVRAGKRTDAQMQRFTESLLARYEWKLWFSDPLSAMLQAIVRELAEIARYESLADAAVAESDAALTAVTRQILSDENEHLAFFQQAVTIIQNAVPDAVTDAVRRIVAAHSDEKHAPALFQRFRIAPDL